MTRTPAATPFGINPALARQFADTFAGQDGLQQVIDTIVGAAQSGLDDLAQWVADVPQMVGRMVNQVIDIFNGVVVTPINNAIAGVMDWFWGLLGFQQETEERIYDTENTVNNQGVIIRGVQDDLVDTAEKADLPNNLPMWQSLNPLEDPSFPRILVNRHQQPAAFFTPQQGRAEIAFIRAPRARRYNTVGCIVDNREGTFSGDLRLGLYRLANNGELQLQEVSDNLAAQIPLGIIEVRYEMQQDYPVAPREYLAVGILMTGGTSCAIAGIEDEWVAAPVGTYPPRSNALSPGGQTTMPVDIPSGQTDFSQPWIPWACLGEGIDAIDEQPLSYRDTFDRPDGTLGHNWATRGQMRIVDREVEHHYTSGQGDLGIATGLWVYPLNTDQQQVSAITSKPTPPAEAPSFIALRTNSQFTRGMYASWDEGRYGGIDVRIGRIVGVNRHQVLAWAAEPWSAGDQFTFKAIGNLYVLAINGHEVLEYRDTEGWLEPGPDQRFVGLGTSRSIADRPSPNIREWAAKDLNRELLQYPSESRYPSRMTYPDNPGDNGETED